MAVDQRCRTGVPPWQSLAWFQAGHVPAVLCLRAAGRYWWGGAFIPIHHQLHNVPHSEHRRRSGVFGNPFDYLYCDPHRPHH